MEGPATLGDLTITRGLSPLARTRYGGESNDQLSCDMSPGSQASLGGQVHMVDWGEAEIRKLWETLQPALGQGPCLHQLWPLGAFIP